MQTLRSFFLAGGAMPPLASNDMRFAFSSIGRWAAAVLALFIAPYYSIRTWAAVVDPDIWWHMRSGDWIIAHHAVPRYAIFSQHIERSWIAYSWLFDVLVSGLYHRFGLAGIPGFLICLQVLISLAFLLAMRHFARSFWWSWLIASLAIYAFYVNPLRSLLFTLLFFTLELLIIFEAERRANDKLLFWTAPLFFLWANIHIQFIHGLSVLALYIATRLISLAALNWLPLDSRDTSPTRLLAIFGAAFAASCIGPNWAYPYKEAFSYAVHTAQYEFIQEMLAMNFRRPEHFVELFLLIAACYVVGRFRSRDLFRPLLLLVTALVAFRSLRDAWFVSIAAAFVLAEAAGQVQPQATVDFAAHRRTRLLTNLNYALAAVAALILSFGLAIRQGMSAPALMTVIDQVYPIRATEFVRDSHLPGPMYNSFNWGGFLIFNLREQPVSIDPRVNAYRDELPARSVNTVNAVRWRDDPDLARANFVLLERSAPLASALENDPRYRLAYKDHVAVIFVRAQTR
jgi:hypothetical protein